MNKMLKNARLLFFIILVVADIAVLASIVKIMTTVADFAKISRYTTRLVLPVSLGSDTITVLYTLVFLTGIVLGSYMSNLRTSCDENSTRKQKLWNAAIRFFAGIIIYVVLLLLANNTSRNKMGQPKNITRVKYGLRLDITDELIPVREAMELPDTYKQVFFNSKFYEKESIDLLDEGMSISYRLSYRSKVDRDLILENMNVYEGLPLGTFESQIDQLAMGLTAVSMLFFGISISGIISTVRILFRGQETSGKEPESVAESVTVPSTESAGNLENDDIEPQLDSTEEKIMREREKLFRRRQEDLKDMSGPKPVAEHESESESESDSESESESGSDSESESESGSDSEPVLEPEIEAGTKEMEPELETEEM